ncbi:MAG TPA: endo alpha-1,4 polygalactosaminidase [Acidimicrobiales bacterium]
MPHRPGSWARVGAAALLATTAAAAACSSGGDGEADGRGRRPTTSTTADRPPAPPSTDGEEGAAVTTPTEGPERPGEGDWWRPTRGLTWQWQLDGGPIDLSVDAEVFDVDLWATTESEIDALHDQGRKVICYLSAGSWEPYRPDADEFPEEVLGPPVDGWPDERWLDIRRLDVLEPLMAARFDLCRAKGFDGVEPDWMDSHTQDTGFDITAEDQLRYNRRLAELAHERGLAIGLKNDLGQVEELADLFDFAVVEQCMEFDECELLLPFLDRDKPVFHAEYDLPTSAFCAEARRLGLSSIRKRLDLGPWRETC